MLFALFLLAVALAEPLQYNLGIRTDSEILEWGVLSLNPKRPSLVEFSPSELVTPPTSGCLGLQTVNGFECMTLFGDIDPEAIQATLVYISPQGTLVQPQLVEGPRSKLDVEVPRFAPKAEVKRPNPAKPEKKGYSKATEAEDVEEVELTFLEKYWKFLVPIGIIVAVNVFGPQKPRN